MGALRVRIAPDAPEPISRAVAEAGATVVTTPGTADFLVWTQSGPAGIEAELAPAVRWVQLPAAGVGPWIDSGHIADGRVWLSAAGVYAEHVAEHAVAGLLAGVHRLVDRTRQGTWAPLGYRALPERTVAVVGGGGIGTAIVGRLTALGAVVAAVTRDGRSIPGAAWSASSSEPDQWLGRVDDVMLALPSTPQTHHFVDERALRSLPADGCVVNVGRGSAIDTDALVRVLADGHLGGVVLDVTDPEPLPQDHPLWASPRVIVTSHSANPRSLRWPALARRVAANIALIGAGAEPIGVIQATRGY